MTGEILMGTIPSFPAAIAKMNDEVKLNFFWNYCLKESVREKWMANNGKYALLILLLSVASIRRKLLKTTSAE